MRRGLRRALGAGAIVALIAGVVAFSFAFDAGAISVGAFGATIGSFLSGVGNGRLPVTSAYVGGQVNNTPQVSPGCGRAAPFAAGNSEYEYIAAGGLSRAFLLHIPTGYQSSRAYPLLLSFHGTGSTAANMQRMTGFSTLADQAGFVVAYPQGVRGPYGATGWSSGGRGHPTLNDTLFVSDMLNTIQARLCINPRHIYASGFSNGGGMTWMLSCMLARRIAAFASVSGSYYPVKGSCEPGRAV